MQNGKKTPKERGWQRKLGVLFHPKNLAKTVASAVPYAGPLVEIQNQLESYHVGERLGALEESDVTLQTKLIELEQTASKETPTVKGWPAAVADYLGRIADLAVVYDGGFHLPAQRGRELVQIVARGCFVGGEEVLTCVEALEVAQNIARRKRGRLIVLFGLAWYDFKTDAPDDLSGLVTCRITTRDEQKWEETTRLYKKLGMEKYLHEPASTSVASSVMPWMGQEIGFLHSGEATDGSRLDRFSKLQFDTITISHLRRPQKGTLKTFVTGVLPGRIMRTGVPVFSREATLLGVISDTESYPSDAGRRAIVKSLLGHPRFTKFEGKK